MRTTLLVLVFILAGGMVHLAQAVPPGLVLEFENEAAGDVTFTGDVHSGTGMHCVDCHLDIFDVSRAAEISRRDHNTEQYCFACHNGETAFAARRNCGQCHADTD
jgi:c(7)-type cytochrome triheme protein